jgi:hypothetical protein
VVLESATAAGTTLRLLAQGLSVAVCG